MNDILPPEGEPWSASMLALSRAERGRYGPEFDQDKPRPPTPTSVIVGLSD